MDAAGLVKSPDDIAAILFDKDGTLIGYDASWGPVNRELAAIAARGDAAAYGDDYRYDARSGPAAEGDAA